MGRFTVEILHAKGLLFIAHLMEATPGVNILSQQKLECNRVGTHMKLQLLLMMRAMFTRLGLVMIRCHGMHIQEIRGILGATR